MPNPINPSHPAEYLAALATQMVAGTSIATVIIQKGLDALSDATPALILNCPRIHRIRKANNAKQAIFTIHALYIGRWESDPRTFEEILAAMQSDLSQAADNIDADPTLGLGPTIAGETIDINVDTPVDATSIGADVIAGEMIIEVKGPWYQST